MERPLERRTAARTAVVWDAVRALLEGTGEQQVLDIGGGTGGFAVRVAALGNRITVIDPSPDALAALARRADEEGVADRVTGLQGDLGNLRELAPRADGCPTWSCATACSASSTTRPPRWTRSPRCCVPAEPSRCWSASGTPPCSPGRWPVTSPRPPACSRVRASSRARTSRSSEHRFTAEELTGLLEGAGFDIRSSHGIRVFTDLVPSSLLDLEPGASAALLELERAVSERPEYLTLASQLHVVATR